MTTLTIVNNSAPSLITVVDNPNHIRAVFPNNATGVIGSLVFKLESFPDIDYRSVPAGNYGQFEIYGYTRQNSDTNGVYQGGFTVSYPYPTSYGVQAVDGAPDAGGLNNGSDQGTWPLWSGGNSSGLNHWKEIGYDQGLFGTPPAVYFELDISSSGGGDGSANIVIDLFINQINWIVWGSGGTRTQLWYRPTGYPTLTAPTGFGGVWVGADVHLSWAWESPLVHGNFFVATSANSANLPDPSHWATFLDFFNDPFTGCTFPNSDPVAYNDAVAAIDVAPTGSPYYRLYSYVQSEPGVNNDIGQWVASSVIRMVDPNLTVPTAPSLLVATTVSDTEIDLTWQDNSSNEENFELETSSDGVTWSLLTSPAANATSYNNTGLSPLTTHYYRIRAVNAAGNSAYSNTANATTFGPPNVPEDFIATVVSTSEIDLTWIDTSNNEDNFRIEYAARLNGTYLPLSTPAAGATSYNATGLSQNFTYFFRIRSENAWGNSAWVYTQAVTYDFPRLVNVDDLYVHEVTGASYGIRVSGWAYASDIGRIDEIVGKDIFFDASAKLKVKDVAYRPAAVGFAGSYTLEPTRSDLAVFDATNYQTWHANDIDAALTAIHHTLGTDPFQAAPGDHAHASADPTASVGLTVVNGVATTFMRSDAAPPLSQAIAPTWTATHTFNSGTTASEAILFDMSGAGGFTYRDSHWLRIVAQSHTGLGALQKTDWKVQSIGTAAGGKLTFQYQINGGGYTTAFDIVPDPTLTSEFYGKLQVGGNLGAANLSGTNTGDQSPANPTASVGLSVVNGSAATFMRSDAAPALSQAITPTWTGLHTFNPGTTSSEMILLDMAHTGFSVSSHWITLTAQNTGGASDHKNQWKMYVYHHGGASTDSYFVLASQQDGGGYTDRLKLSMFDTANSIFTGPITASNLSGTNTGDQTTIGAVTVADDTTTNATMYPVWVAGSSGAQAPKVSSTKLFFNPSTGLVSLPSAAIIGTAGAGYLTMVAQSSNPSSPAAGTLLLHSSTTQGFTRMEQDNEAATNLVLGRDNVFIAKNTTVSTIAKGSAVYVTGSTGNVPNIGLAKADSTTTLPAVGIALDAIGSNNFGQVMMLGILASYDTSAFSTGDILYVSATVAGAFTKTRPVSPLYAQRVGSVLVSGVGNGSVFVDIAPFIGGLESGTTVAAWVAAGTISASNLSGTNTGDQSGANPTATATGAAINGVATTFMRSDAAFLINLDASHGGTGIMGGYAVGDLLYASAAGTLSRLADVAAGSPLLSGGVTTAPAYAGFLLSGTTGGTTSLAVTSGKTLTLTATDNYNLTVPATGTAALLGVANTFTQQIYLQGGTNFGYTGVADPVMADVLTGAWIPRLADLGSGWTQWDFMDEFAFFDKRASATYTSTPAATGTLSDIFRDDSAFVTFASGSSPFPIVLEFDTSSAPILVANNAYYQLALTFRGTTPAITHIKVEMWDTTAVAYATVYDQDVSIGAYGYWLSKNMLAPVGSSYNVYKVKVTISGTNPLGSIFYLQRVMLYHPTAETDPWHLHKRGGAVYGAVTMGSTLTVSGAFGCNTKAAQTAYASGGAAPAGGTGATAGAYDTAAHRDALITLVNNIRTALVNNGIMS